MRSLGLVGRRFIAAEHRSQPWSRNGRPMNPRLIGTGGQLQQRSHQGIRREQLSDSRLSRLNRGNGGSLFPTEVRKSYSLLIDGKIWLRVYYMPLNQPLSTPEICKASRWSPIEKISYTQSSTLHIFIEFFCGWWYNNSHENNQRNRLLRLCLSILLHRCSTSTPTATGIQSADCMEEL